MLRFTAASLALASCLAAASAHADAQCTRIGAGTIRHATGEVVTTGFDRWGYNYQARFFWGDYCDALRGVGTCAVDAGSVDLSMKWNDAWLSNKDCDGDGLLDRHAGFESYRGSGARLINVMHGTYLQNQHECHWFYVTRILAAPLNAVLDAGIWYDEHNEPLGPVVWDDFYVVKDKLVDPCDGAAATTTLF